MAISDAHLETVRAAVRAAFGPDRIDAIEPVSGGASGAFPFRVSIRDRDYLVRVEGPASPLRNPHQYGSMRIAAEHRIAPRIHHVDEAARVVVTDFVRTTPLTRFPGGRRRLVEAVGDLLARLRATPRFPRYVEYPDIVSRLWNWVCRTGLFAPGVLDPFTERLRELCHSYGSDPADAVSAHNDPVPGNILFDGSRLWLVDWESAYRNDPFVDLAIVLDNLAPSLELETALIAASCGHPPDGEFRRRLGAARSLARLYYAGVLLSASFDRSGALADDDARAPTLGQVRDDVTTGRLLPGTPAMPHLLGKMYLASFLSDAAPPPLDPDLLLAEP